MLPSKRHIFKKAVGSFKLLGALSIDNNNIYIWLFVLVFIVLYINVKYMKILYN